MKIILLTLLTALPAFSQTLSLNQLNPIAQMHMLPGGEAPGWTSPEWFELEYNEANFWSAPSLYKNLNTGRTLTFTSAYEQSSIFFEYGRQLSTNFAMEVEAPVVRRYGGAGINHLIAGYHKIFGFDTFQRSGYTDSQGTMETSTDGESRRSNVATSGLSNIKFKLKYWPVHWRKNTGFGANFQIKIPIAREDTGLTSGSMDYSLLLHLAFPIGDDSFFYSTIGGTYAQKNWMFQDWPRQTFLWMADILLDLGINENWGIIFSDGYQSPLMHKGDLQFLGLEHPTGFNTEDRIASSTNALVHFRGEQMVGLRRYFHDKKNMFMIYFLEDFAFGDRDYTGDISYSNNQPDFGLGTKIFWNF